MLKRIGFDATEKVVTAGSYWTTIGDEKTRAQIGFADFVQDYPHPLDWFGLLDGQQHHADAQLELRELRRRLGESRDRGAHAASQS